MAQAIPSSSPREREVSATAHNASDASTSAVIWPFPMVTRADVLVSTSNVNNHALRPLSSYIRATSQQLNNTSATLIAAQMILAGMSGR